MIPFDAVVGALRRVVPHPPVDGDVIDLDTPFAEQLFDTEVSETPGQLRRAKSGNLTIRSARPYSPPGDHSNQGVVVLDVPIFEVVIGVVFVLTLFSVAVSALTEATTRFMGLRGAQLLRGIKSLVDGTTEDGQFTTTYKLFGSVFLGTVGQKERTRDSYAAEKGTDATVPQLADGETGFEELVTGGFSNMKAKRKLPSYIASRQFASAVLGEILPDLEDGEPRPPLSGIRQKIEQNLGDSPLRDQLMSIVNETGNDVDAIRSRLETTYDDHMGRVSGWYKRHASKVQILFAVVIVLFFNINLLRIGDHLLQDDASRAAIVEVAAEFECETNEEGGISDVAQCQQQARQTIEELEAGGLPVFWNGSISCEGIDEKGDPEVRADSGTECFFHSQGIWVADESTMRNVIFLVVGYGAAILGLIPGSRFWFDALGKLNSLRSTGSKPPTTSGNKSVTPPPA